MHYPQIVLYRRILYGLLIPNALFGLFILYSFFRSDSSVMDMLPAIIGLGLSVFQLALFITLINYVEYLDLRIGQLQRRLLNEDLKQSPAAESPGRSLSQRIGKL
jgi:hypothetical protein